MPFMVGSIWIVGAGGIGGGGAVDSIGCAGLREATRDTPTIKFRPKDIKRWRQRSIEVCKTVIKKRFCKIQNLCYSDLMLEQGPKN